MAAPSALVLVCEECGEVPHRVLSGRVTGKDALVFQGTVKCSSCGRVTSVTYREDRPVAVPLVLSDREASERDAIDLGPEELVSVGDRLDHAGHRIEVTSIEVGERRVPSAAAKAIRMLWAKRRDRVVVKFSVNKGNRGVRDRGHRGPRSGEGGDPQDARRDDDDAPRGRTRGRHRPHLREARPREDVPLSQPL